MRLPVHTRKQALKLEHLGPQKIEQNVGVDHFPEQCFLPFAMALTDRKRCSFGLWTALQGELFRGFQLNICYYEKRQFTSDAKLAVMPSVVVTRASGLQLFVWKPLVYWLNTDYNSAK